MNRVVRRQVASLLAAAIALNIFSAQVAAWDAPDVFPLVGAMDVSQSATSISVSFSFTAPAGARITDLRISLVGPGLSEELYRVVAPSGGVTSFVERTGLEPGGYTVTASAEIARGARRASGMTSQPASVGVTQPAPGITRAVPPIPEPEADADPDPLTIAATVAVYGATPSGILAALSAARSGVSVALIEPTGHVGGMMTSGLSATDYGHPGMLGGFTDEFFDRVQAMEGSAYGRWRFQPSTAETVFLQMLAEAGVAIYANEAMAGPSAVTMDGTRIDHFDTTLGRSVDADVFVDASYEGDLMAAAGVSHAIGREPASAYGESHAGIGVTATIFTAPTGIDPGFPVAAPTGPVGSGDNRIQYPNYRLCFSTNPANQVPFSEPEGYDPATYDIVAAYIDWRVGLGHQPDLTWFLWPVALTNGKYDVNNNGQVAIGLHGLSIGYPGGNATQREAITEQLRGYTEGFLHFLDADPRVPSAIRNQMAAYGLCADEFADTQNWPRMFYLREGRRMIGETVVTERDVVLTRTKADTIGIASYAFDSHHVSRWIDGSSRLRVEGGFWNGRAAATRWSIPYSSLTPHEDEATNLLVSVAVSASHVAFASLRMEPQYMLMGEAAGTAAAMASGLGGGSGEVQSISVGELRAVLRARGSVVDNHLFWDLGSSPFKGDIEATFLRGVTFGCTPINFCPTAIMQRQVMAAWLARALDLPPATRDYFTDDETSAHEDSINRVAEAGITAGCGAGKFCPTSGVTRGQMAAFLKRAFELPPTTRDFFTDDETSMFEGDINRLAASGITAGCGGTKFCPAPIVPREQMAAFIWRAIR